jgi:hypothetical protein
MQDLNQIRADIISEIFDDSIYYPSTGEVFVFCPNGCHDKKRKLQINVNKGVGQCWVCGLTGSALSLVSKFGDKRQKANYASTIPFGSNRNIFEIEQTQSVDLPEDFVSLNESTSPVAYPAKKYLKKFNINELEINRFQIGICTSGEHRNRIIFPSYGEDGRVNCFNTRSIFDSYIKYFLVGSAKGVVFNEIFVNWKKPIVLVENVKAHIRHFDIGNVVPILGKKFTESYVLFQSIVNNSCGRIFLALDPTETEKSMEYKRMFEHYGMDVKCCVLTDQPDELSTSDFFKQVFEDEEAEEIDPLESLIRGK